MKKKSINVMIFILTTVSLIISVRLFYNMGIYVDEYGTSPDIVSGGNFWLMMDWLRLFILGTLFVVSLIKLFDKENS